MIWVALIVTMPTVLFGAVIVALWRRRSREIERHLREAPRLSYAFGELVLAVPEHFQRGLDLGQAVTWLLLVVGAWPTWALILASATNILGIVYHGEWWFWWRASLALPAVGYLGVIASQRFRPLGWRRLVLKHQGLCIDRVRASPEAPRRTVGVLEAEWHRVERFERCGEVYLHVRTGGQEEMFGPLPKAQAQAVAEQCAFYLTKDVQRPGRALTPLVTLIARAKKSEGPSIRTRR
ncbi:MAG: hypothetical protein AAGA48_06815 [Myxococcota bacterium]